MGIRTWRRILYEKLPLFGLSPLAAVTTFFVHKKAGVLSVFDVVPRMLRLENALISCARYLGKIFWPANLEIPYRYSETYDIAALCDRCHHSRRDFCRGSFSPAQKQYLFTGWFWFLGTLVPVIGLVQIGAQAMADRYTYIPAIGIFIGVTWFCADLFARWRIPHVPSLDLRAHHFRCVIKTSFQLTYWENTETLFNAFVELIPKTIWPSKR